MKKRLLTISMALVMVFSLLPTISYAGEPSPGITPEPNKTDDPGTQNPGNKGQTPGNGDQTTPGTEPATPAEPKKPAEPEVTIPSGNVSSVNVYYDGVKGKVPAGTKEVNLYKDGSLVKTVTPDSDGNFSISYDFGSRYYNRGYYDSYGNYRYYRDGYYYGYDYDLSRFKLEAKYDGKVVDSYTISNSDAYNYGYKYGYWDNYYYDRYYDYNRKVYPSSLSLNYASDVVSGYLTSYPNTYVSVYSNGSYVGSGYTNSNGYFTISLNKYVYSTGNLDFYVGSSKSYVDNDYRIYPWSVNVESYAVSGYYDKNTKVSVYYDGSYIGSDVTDSNGYFRISSSTRLYDNSLLKFYGPEKAKTETTTKTNNYKTTITIGNAAITQTVNGSTTTKYMDVAPYIKDGRTMLPIRFVAESLGYYVNFNDATRNATFSDGNSVVVINIDSSEFYVDGVKNTFSVRPEIKDGRTMLPISEIGRALGLSHGNKGEGKNIEWDSTNRVVTIETSKSK